MNLKFRTVWVLLLVTAGALTLHAQTPVEENLRRADTQFDLYAYNTALNTYNEVLKAEPNNAYALGRKGDCYFQLNKPQEALPFYDRAVTLGRVDPEIVFRYAQALMQSGDYVGAKRWFNFYGESNPSVGQHYAAMCDYAITAVQRTGMFSAKNELLNSPAADYSPAFYGNRIIYNSARRDITRKTPRTEGGSGTNEIFITQRNPEDGLLQRPGFLLADLQKSTFFNEGPVAYSGNGVKVAFCHNKFVDGTRQIAAKGIEMSLYLADVNADGKWATIQPFQYNGSDYAVGFPWLSEDGNTLCFASNMQGGMGGWDLYSSTFNATTKMWSTPRNLGATINTPGNEITPFMDGNDLYFASDWHNGIGGLDVFRADYSNNYGSNVTNLGTGVNSSRDDYGFIYNSKDGMGYFTSNRPEGKGNEDIWQVGRGMDEFSITVRDPYQQPIPNAEIDFSACGAGTMRTDANGRYEFATSKGQANCNVTVRSGSYPPVTVTVSSAGEHNIAVSLGTTSAATYSTATVVYNEALGSVVDYESRDPLYSTKVSAAPWPNGPSVETYTNINGQYTLNLDPARAYTITYTREGYGDMAINYFSGDAGAQSTVAQVSMSKKASNTVVMTPAETKVRSGAQSVPAATVSTQPNYTQPNYTQMNTQVGYPGTITTSTATAPVTHSAQPVKSPIYQPVEVTTPYKPVISGYSVQLAATPVGGKEPDMTKFNDLAGEGNLYTVQEGNNSKLRMGVFATKNEADAALRKARAIRKDAFIVEEKNADANLAISSSEGQTNLLASKGDDLTVRPSAPQLLVPQTQFAVQIKTKGITEPVIMNEYADLAQFGSLYTRPDNGVIRIRVGVWNTQTDAELAQSLIMGKGYREAVVVVEKAGTDVPAAAKPQIISTPAVMPAATPATGTPLEIPTPVTPKPVAGSTGAVGGPGFTPVATNGGLPDLLSPTAYSTTAKGTFKAIDPNPMQVKYMVRICSLTGDPTKFDVKKAEQAGGRIDARQSATGAVIMLLTDFANEQTATVAKDKLKTLGFADAFVVKELEGDGVLRRVSE